MITSAVAFKLIGWSGQALFFLRFFIQWLASEHAGRIVVPRTFWSLSLVGSIATLSYAFYDDRIIFVLGAAANGLIYARNIALSRGGHSLGTSTTLGLVLAVLGISILAWTQGGDRTEPLLWLWIGGIGQLLWIARFPLQWVIAERRAAAELPQSFFAVSLLGSILLLAYAIHTGNPIWIAGMALSPFLYIRNLILGARRPESPEADTTTG